MLANRPQGSATVLLRGVAQPGLREWVAALPTIVLSLIAFGFAGALVAAIVLPALLSLIAAPRSSRPGAAAAQAGHDRTGRETAAAALDRALADCHASGRRTASIVVAIDGVEDLAARLGLTACDQIVRQTFDRLEGTLREDDVLARLDGGRFALALGPVRRADLETLIQIAGRLQDAVAQPCSVDAATIYATVSVGFCLQSRAPAPKGAAMLAAAEAAADDAVRNGPGGIRAYTVEIERNLAKSTALRDEVAAAIEAGQVTGYFQPQLSTDTGEVTGFEALARWVHPTRGVLSPAEFIPAIRAAGLSAELSKAMLFQALTALRSWDRLGVHVPSIGINFSKDELSDPKLTDKLKWELDRFEIVPNRLTVEILESVVTETDEDVVVRNVAALGKLGCSIDLDDFGTGHASIATIRRFAVDRIKIDRSFVTRVDCDDEQRRMLSAILSMAERLGIATLAEGVETIAEHAMLAQLGCDHVQGYVIARPMPFSDTTDWLARHRAKLSAAPRFDRKAI